MHKTQQPVSITTIEATADLTNLRFVTFDGAPAAADDVILGVCQADTSAGQQAPVGILGVFVVEAGGPIAVGGTVASDDFGRAVAGDTNPIGRALDQAFLTGDQIRVLIR